MPDAEWSRRFAKGVSLLVLILIAVSTYRFGGLPPLVRGRGLAALIDPVGHASEVAAVRESRLTLTKGSVLLGERYTGQGLLNTFTESGWLVVVVAAVVLWTWRRDRASAIRLLLIVALAFIFLGSAGSRGPLVFTALCGLAALTLRIRPSNRHLAWAAVGIGVLVLLIMPLSKGARAGTDLGSRVDAAWVRVTEGNGRNTAHIINLVDSGRLEPFHGRLVLERSLAVLPGVAKKDPFAYRLNLLVNGSGRNTTGYLTPTQFGLLYAEGRFVAVLAGYAACGALFGLIWRAILRIRSRVGVVLAPIVAITLGKAAITGVPGMIAALSMAVFALAVMWVPVWLNEMGRRSNLSGVDSNAVRSARGLVIRDHRGAHGSST